MIIVLVKYSCKPDCREQFLNAIKAQNIDVLSTGEPGNHKYEYSYAVDDKNTLILTEVWESLDAVKQHAQTPHYQVLGKLKAEYVENTTIQRFEGSLL